MKIGEAIKKAVSEGNAAMAGRVSDILRFRCGYTYPREYALVKELTGATEAEWEALLYEAEFLEGST